MHRNRKEARRRGVACACVADMSLLAFEQREGLVVLLRKTGTVQAAGRRTHPRVRCAHDSGPARASVGAGQASAGAGALLSPRHRQASSKFAPAAGCTQATSRKRCCAPRPATASERSLLHTQPPQRPLRPCTRLSRAGAWPRALSAQRPSPFYSQSQEKSSWAHCDDVTTVPISLCSETDRGITTGFRFPVLSENGHFDRDR